MCLNDIEYIRRILKRDGMKTKCKKAYNAMQKGEKLIIQLTQLKQ